MHIFSPAQLLHRQKTNLPLRFYIILTIIFIFWLLPLFNVRITTYIFSHPHSLSRDQGLFTSPNSPSLSDSLALNSIRSVGCLPRSLIITFKLTAPLDLVNASLNPSRVLAIHDFALLLIQMLASLLMQEISICTQTHTNSD